MSLQNQETWSRRRWLRCLALGGSAMGLAGAMPGLSMAGFWESGRFAEELAKTPRIGAGPFYPDKMPLDTDNDLLILNDSIDPAVGKITHLSGRVFDVKGNPVRNATVEIWQADSEGIYLHTESQEVAKIDANFQGFGRFLTDSKGRYYFRTIQPVPYRPRTAPHIHFTIKKAAKHLLTTEMAISGHPGNADDIVHRQLSKESRAALAVEFKPLEGSKIGELVANFDIVVGMTPVVED